MALNIPESGIIFLPAVPEKIKKADPDLYSYLLNTKREVERVIGNLFANADNVVGAINSGTSGTFTISSGGSIIITSGIVITVTS